MDITLINIYIINDLKYCDFNIHSVNLVGAFDARPDLVVVII